MAIALDRKDFRAMTDDADRVLRDRTCTGLTAVWCPVHGDCSCPPRTPAGWDQKGRPRAHKDDYERDMDGGSLCPLHRFESDHAEVRAVLGEGT